MTGTKINTFRIDVNYAAAQGSYCAGMCALNAFTAVYLIFKGFSNAQTGATVSLLSMLAIVIQLFVSNLADSHTNIPLKKIITVLYLVTIAACTILWVLPLPVALMIVAYSIGGATQRSIMGLLNAMMMQFTNAGLHVNYGWPRGVCSILFALTAFVLGILVERYSPDIIMPVSIGLTVFGVVSVMVMPDPRKFAAQTAETQPADAAPESKPAPRPLSYVAMFRTNPTLSLFIAASVILALGQSTASVFLIRIMESVGGSAQDLGTAILIQAGIEFPMLFASAWVLKKYKVGNLLVFSYFANAVRQFGFVIAPTVGAMYGVMTINIFCIGIYAFASVMFVHSIVKPSEMVRAQTLVVLAQTLGQIIGSMVSGVFIDIFGLTILLIIGVVILLISTGVMMVCNRSYTRRFPQSQETVN